MRLYFGRERQIFSYLVTFPFDITVNTNNLKLITRNFLHEKFGMRQETNFKKHCQIENIFYQFLSIHLEYIIWQICILYIKVKRFLHTYNQNDHIKNRLVQKLSGFIYLMSNY